MGLAALLLLALVVDATLVVKTQEGIVKGVTLPLAPYLPNSTATADGFLGIPYAEQPERWTPSVKKQPWSGARDASSFGPGCPQVCLLPPGTCPATQSEDCLSLNVYAPSGARQGLAVLVFLPGGRFEQGASDTYLYDGRFLVQSRQIIVVTINYRLGALGFMYTPGGESQGNYGVQDQLLALQWVQRNIAAFGGDPNKVTLDGQSAGGASVVYHLLNKGSVGLFQRAVVQSNPQTIPWKEQADGEELGKLFGKHLGCGDSGRDLTCMRKATVAEVLTAQHDAQQHFSVFDPLIAFLPWTPMVGTGPTALPQQPLVMFAAGNVASKVPLMTGVVANETLLFVYEGLGSNPSAALYYAFVADVFGEHAFRVLAEYPPHRDNRTVLHSMSLLGTDYIMACPTRAVARAVPGSFLYYFDHVMSFSQVGWGANYTECWNLTCHGEELPFQFGSADMVIPNAYTVDEKALVKTMQSAWLNFVAAPTPMPWQPFGNATQAAMYFAAPESQVARFPRQGKCDFFDSIGYGRAGRFVEALAALSR